jgi:hypothetical protein
MGRYTNTSQHYDALGAFYVPERHATDDGKALLNLRDMDEQPGALRTLLARLTEIVVIAH